MSKVNLPQYIRDALRKGLKLHSERPSGGIVPETLRFARMGVNTGSWPESKIIKADNWFARHVFDRKRMKNPRSWDDPPNYSPAYVAWLLWGSDSDNRGREWISKKADIARSKQEAPKGGASTPAPPEDRIKGGRNTGRASKSAKRPISLSKATNVTLSKKADDHNKSVDGDKSKKATLRMLQKVYLRGAGAFSTSHRPGMTRGQWAFGRVNAFLYLLKNGKPESDKYITDNDLLPAGHPRASKSKEAKEMNGYDKEMMDGYYKKMMAGYYKKMMAGHMQKDLLQGVLKMICHDLYSIADMMDADTDMETLKRIIMSTHDRYALLAGKGHGGEPEVDIDIDVEPDDVDSQHNYRMMSQFYPEREAVEDPTPEQRSGLPSAAYEPAAFFANKDGEFDPDGTFLSSKSKLPHHINDVSDPNENSSVDVPRLRNAMARFNQVDWSQFPPQTRTASKAHLERHADAVLYGNNEGSCSTCSKEELELLRKDLNDFRMCRYSEIVKRLIS